MKSEVMQTIRGDVLPLAGRKDCRAILVGGDKEYHIQPKGAGADLVEHFSEQVELEGAVTEDEDGILWVHVWRYKLVDTLDDDALYED